MPTAPIWILDSSSLITIRTQTARTSRERMYAQMARLVSEGRLRFPPEVIGELKRYVGAENPALEWALANATTATKDSPALNAVQAVLASVPEVLDPDKEGTEEADPYVLAMATDALGHSDDVRVITEDVKATGAKMSLAGAAGYLGIPAVTLRVFLKFEGIADWE